MAELNRRMLATLGVMCMLCSIENKWNPIGRMKVKYILSVDEWSSAGPSLLLRTVCHLPHPRVGFVALVIKSFYLPFHPFS